MPARNQVIIRRDINRLKEVIERTKATNPALLAISAVVTTASDKVNKAWQDYQKVAVQGDKERNERDEAINVLIKWIQRWRPIILLSVPGADKNIKNLPSTGATPDDVIRVAEDMIEFMRSNPGASSFNAPANSDLGTALTNAKKETGEATAILPQEASARQAFTDECNSANNVLVKGLDVVRAIFGATSPEYKQFIARSSSKEEEEIDAEASVGEE